MKNREMLTVHLDGALEIKNTDNAKRIYASINSAVFIINQLQFRYEEMLTGFAEVKSFYEKKGEVKGGKVTICLKYPKNDLLVAKAWDFIDWSERLRKILSSISGVKKKDDWYKDLMKAIGIVKPVRQFIQHFDREISKFISGQYPLMGTVYAFIKVADGYNGFFILSSPVRSAYDNEINIARVDFPVSPKEDIENVCFAIEKHIINISQVMGHITLGKRELEVYLKTEYNFDWPVLGT